MFTAANGIPIGLELSATGPLSGKVGLHKYPNGGSLPITLTVTDSTKRIHQTATATFTVAVS